MKTVDPLAGWYSAQDLAGLPGMPGTDRRVRSTAEKNLWPSRAKVRGKGLEYPLRALPEATRAYILSLAINAASTAVLTPSADAQSSQSSPAPVQAPSSSTQVATVQTVAADLDAFTSGVKPSITTASTRVAAHRNGTLPAGAVAVRGQLRQGAVEDGLTDRDRITRDASLMLCRAVESAMHATDCSLRRACQELAERLVAGDVRPELLAAATTTYLKPRPGLPLGGVSAQATRLYKLMGFFEQGRMAGDVARYLVPGKRASVGHNPVHIAAFLRFYCRPSRPPISEAYREMVPFLTERGLESPSYGTVVRIEQSLPVTVKYRGRVTGSEWRGLKPYIERDVSMFKSNDIWVGDGHSFKAKVAHPIHGQPYTPEITVMIDWVSRKIVGWSIALSESTVAVSDAFRHAQLQTRARPLVYYSDNGSGQTGKMIDHPIAGTLARQGIAHETGIPGNPQARGIIERLWQVTLIPLARTYATCTWRGADENARNKMIKSLNKANFGGVALPPFLQLVDDVKACVETYNTTHAHRELAGNVPDDEYLAKFDPTSIVFGPNDAEIAALWMPEVIRKPQRGRVSLFGNQYCLARLTDVLPEGASVRVRYDLHHPEAVRLFTMEGLYLGAADWHSHKTAAFPVPEMDRLRAVRTVGRVKTLEDKIAEAQAELGDVLDLTPVVSAPAPMLDPSFMPVGVDPDLVEDAQVMGSWDDQVAALYHVPMSKYDDETDDPDFKEAAR